MANTKGGLDQVTTRFLKVLIPCERHKMEQLKTDQQCTKMGKSLKRLVDAIWDGKEIPDTMSIAAIFSLMKKGDPTIRDNYSGISLIPVIMKVLTKTVASRMQSAMEDQKLFDEAQGGFRSLEEAIAQYCCITRRVRKKKYRRIKIICNVYRF
eukprot:Lithocolla_globosa_v1_NODE_2386_length_2027_cov_12.612576.p1 type:complete len:153 gc:universal NODE_2386_length_2027_cov_12.612576:1007-549(-)